MTMLATTVVVSTPAQAHHDANVTQSVVAYDTAWELPYKATQAEQIAYMDHLVQAGFTGAWIAYMTTTGSAFTNATAKGDMQAEFGPNGEIVFPQDYADDVTWLLDEMDARGLKVGFVTSWGVRYLHGPWVNGYCENLNQGPLNLANSYSVGSQIAADFANHPAISYFVLGGDNFCGQTAAEREDPQIWANVAQGLTDGGVTKPITFHSSPLVPFMLEFINEPWIDFLSIETGHCMPTSQMESILTNAVNHPSGKDIYAAEMRYEGFEPAWTGCQEHGPGDPVLPSDVESDTLAALRSGVTGLLYGHDDRWRWDPGVMGTFGAPGETLFMHWVGPHMATPIYPTTTSTSSTSTSSTTSTTSTTTTTAAPTTTTTTAAPTTTTTTTTSTTTTTAAPTTTTSTTTTTTLPAVFCEGVQATIIGTNGADVIVGTSGRDVIVAKAGNDTIDARGGNDLVCAGNGKDTIIGGRGNDVLAGGAGRDIIKGGPGQDVLRGGAMGDRLRGGAGNDHIEGGKGNDRLDGGPGIDGLYGQSGGDRHFGGLGADVCVGGGGNNKFKSC